VDGDNGVALGAEGADGFVSKFAAITRCADDGDY